MNDDMMCKCEHTLSFHWGEDGSCHMSKNGRFINVSDQRRYRDGCKAFKPDNLKYLEEKSK